MRQIRAWALVGALVVSLTGGAQAETVNVKYRGSVDLAPFACQVDRAKLLH